MAPFVRGGAELLAERLTSELIRVGHKVDLVRLPLDWRSAEGVMSSMSTAANIRIPNADQVISLKFPAYYAKNHDGKNTIWLMHQFRQVYELWNTPFGYVENVENSKLKELITKSDTNAFLSADKLFCNSEVTAGRMKAHNNVHSEVMLAPPVTDIEGSGQQEYKPFIFAFGRVSPAKRQLEAVKAMNFTKSNINLVVAGMPESQDYHNEIVRSIENLKDPSRVSYIPRFITESEKRSILSECRATYYAPFDEDSYGYVTLESAYSRKATITGLDSGGIHALIANGLTGRVESISPEELAPIFDDVFYSKRTWIELGNNHYKRAMSFNLRWNATVEDLVS
jgi:glycosyltransferase involved in cell wall biosynthesis